MSAYESLLKEFARQPESVAQKLLDYFHALAPDTTPQPHGAARKEGGRFSTYWRRFFSRNPRS